MCAKWNKLSNMCKKQTKNKPHNIKNSDDPTSLLKTEVWYSHGSCIDAEFGQSWLCFIRQQGLTRWNVTAGSGLIFGRAGREQRSSSGLTWPLHCCTGMSSGCMCARGNKADLSFSSQLQPFTPLLRCLQLAMVSGFVATASSPPGALSRDLEM